MYRLLKIISIHHKKISKVLRIGITTEVWIEAVESAAYSVGPVIECARRVFQKGATCARSYKYTDLAFWSSVYRSFEPRYHSQPQPHTQSTTCLWNAKFAQRSGRFSFFFIYPCIFVITSKITFFKKKIYLYFNAIFSKCYRHLFLYKKL